MPKYMPLLVLVLAGLAAAAVAQVDMQAGVGMRLVRPVMEPAD